MALWIAANAAAFSFRYESEIQRQKAFEARQTDVLRREQELAQQHLTMPAQNTKLTEEIAHLTTDLHQAVCINPCR